jgi:hypothetical protein
LLLSLSCKIKAKAVSVSSYKSPLLPSLLSLTSIPQQKQKPLSITQNPIQAPPNTLLNIVPTNKPTKHSDSNYQIKYQIMGGAEQASGTGGGSMERLKPVLGMILVQTGFAGMNIFYKLAIDDGMDLRILTAYRYAFATVFLVPLAFILERYVLVH